MSHDHNLNDLVTVRLTEKGLSILRNSPQSRYLTPDEFGQIRTTLWEIAHIFGPYFFNGGPNLFVNNEIKFVAKEPYV